MEIRRIKHGGDLAAEAEALGVSPPESGVVDFSVNLNPFGPPADVAAEIAVFDAAAAAAYPEPDARSARSALAAAHGVPAAETLVGPGATALFSWLVSALEPSAIHAVGPCYQGYAETAALHGVPFEFLSMASPDDGFSVRLDALDFSAAEMVFLGSPNNPTGGVLAPEEVAAAAAANPETFFVVDESFVDFLPDDASFFRRPVFPSNVAVVKSLTKFFSIAGLRVGVLRSVLAAETAAKRPPWSVNSLACRVAERLYADGNFLEDSRRLVRGNRESFFDGLGGIAGIRPLPSEANFILCELRGKTKGTELAARLLERGFLIRRCSEWPGLGDAFVRLAVRTGTENAALLEALSEVVGGVRGKRGGQGRKRRAKTRIMVVGTSSGAGKSVVAAGLCRLLARRGIKTAPFKAQNMSLNSCVTPEGGEIGRAQALQAEAAGTAPHTDMNPVLLKPEGDNRSQVVIDGKARFALDARSYYDKKREVREAAWRAFDRLAERYDAIVLEGAGSPAEINLMAEDFVNMSMAEHAEAAAILVADIDRGGVFASILGTVKLLPPRHRRLLAGIVINKFRGDVSLLDSGIEEIERLTGVPVLGVLPFVPDLPLDEEDALDLESPRGGGGRRGRGNRGVVEVAVLRLPRISNFTDFAALERRGDVLLKYTARAEDVATADLIILPGTKNTITDMEWLESTGLGAATAAAAERGVPVVGICGGYQMLGAEIADPDGVEGAPRTVRGLGLLPTRTVLKREKRLSNVAGTAEGTCPFVPPGTAFEGYEIHVGESKVSGGTDIEPPLRIVRRDGKKVSEPEGAVSADGNIFGTYVHGFFDSAATAEGVVSWAAGKLLARGGGSFPPGAVSAVSAEKEKEAAFDLMADLLEPVVSRLGIGCGARSDASTLREKGAVFS